MTGTPLLAVAVRPAVDGSLLLAVTGEIDLATVDRLRDTAFTALAERRPAVLVLDLAEVSFLDLSGVSALLAIRARASATGTRVVLCHPQPIVRRVLELTDLLPAFGL